MRDQATSASAMMTFRNSSISSLRLSIFAHLAVSASPSLIVHVLQVEVLFLEVVLVC